MVKHHPSEPLTYLNIVVLILSVYLLIAMLLNAIIQLPENICHVLAIVDDFICLIFMIDFVIRFRKAENKWVFMKWGWIDLLASIPNVDFLRYGQAFRVFRIIRILRAFQSTRQIINHLVKKKIQGTFTAAALVSILLIIFSSIAILQFETDPESNIKSGEEALWWAFSTITTVGYGDHYPVTTEGRLIAVILMTVGVGLFGTFSAFVTTWFMKQNLVAESEEAE
jgi:voltage-gated potassium channel